MKLLREEPLVPVEPPFVQYQLRLHPVIKATLEILCARTKRSMSAMCLYLLESSFAGVKVQPTSDQLDKKIRLSKPNTLRLSLHLHTLISTAAAENTRSMNMEMNARIYDHAVDMLESPKYNRRNADTEWLILQHLTEANILKLRRMAADRSMDIFEYSGLLLTMVLEGSFDEYPIRRL